MAVALGHGYSIVVGALGDVFAWGSNHFQQLGTGDIYDKLTPARVIGLSPLRGLARQVAAGSSHTGIVTETGDLLMCGHGVHGQLGLGDPLNRSTPTLVPREQFGGESVVMVDCGSEYTAVVTEGGAVYTFGWAAYGRLGRGKAGLRDCQSRPRQIPAASFNNERIVMVSTGHGHAVALSAMGHVFTWGNPHGHALGCHNDLKQHGPLLVDPSRLGGEMVAFVSAGQDQTAAVTVNGRLYTWGKNSHGMLGHGHNLNVERMPTLVTGSLTLSVASEKGQVVVAAFGHEHTLVVTRDGGLWVCGNGDRGQLGLANTSRISVFERMSSELFSSKKIAIVAAGIENSAAVTDDGVLWTWGACSRGSLGHGDMQPRAVPTPVTTSPLHHMRVGRLLPLPPEHVLAFVMSQSNRVGAASEPSKLKTELLKMIVEATSSTCGLDRTQHQAVITLLGGYRALHM